MKHSTGYKSCADTKKGTSKNTMKMSRLNRNMVKDKQLFRNLKKNPGAVLASGFLWSQQGMILRLPDYESGALTN